MLDENLVFEFLLPDGSWLQSPDDTFVAALVWHTDHGDTMDDIDFRTEDTQLLLDGPMEKLPIVFDKLRPIAEAIATIRLKRGS